MPILYFDTCALVKRYYKENGHEKVKQLINTSTNTVVLNDFGSVEVASALRKKYRQNDLTETNARLRLARFLYDRGKEYTVYDTTSSVLLDSIGLVSKHDLRSLDSIHLSTALKIREKHPNLQFVTADGDLYQAAESEGMNPIWPGKPT
ncbi:MULTISPECIES: type II toxin-antitoxin system VapC family toxin [unclassified Haloferax]|uniref:type II toxin-antitoxin system VapC family toxin n=1 Tax=unclassified Haloferax TaxID=2625095 RepID=UPI0002AFC8D0|nr:MULTISPECIES: type II toxin-antitoxin system VapC family toxin [unclassified Haloferax]ELZ58121.1 hypothetical protein C460_10063 [Haloferax sp. ATCC BAA-646]ELZ62906.1 hypothetical protein C459_11440 [Haloferax sp. ATCC BAA-645]ELZ63324.1 hypothetical protein C458_16249 [Haloferax sp. ATCC BAA-644]